MADHEHSVIKHDDHLLLDQTLLRLPHELVKKNLRTAHFIIEKDQANTMKSLHSAATGAVSGKASPAQTLKNLDAMLAKVRGTKRKLVALAQEESRIHDETAARISHLNDLHQVRTVEDVKYETWSRKRLDRLLVDYMLRKGYYESAKQLAQERDIEKLVDIDTFEKQGRIRKELLEGRVQEALSWCADNKKELRKVDNKLEFMLRFQQYIELVRQGTTASLLEAIAHAKKHIIPYRAAYPREVKQACGLLALPPRATAIATGPYRELHASRWIELADLFTKTYNSLLSMPDTPLLHIALSSGLSALKTPTCRHTRGAGGATLINNGDGTGVIRFHSVAPGKSHTPTSSSSSTSRGVCPICSTELNGLAQHVPYAHHTKSHVQSDLVMLPSGRTRGKQALLDEAKKAGLEEGWVKDSTHRREKLVPVDSLKKVYIT